MWIDLSEHKQMKATPRKLKGGAQRVRKQAETPKHDEEMIMDQDATPTEASVKKYEFQAPKYHDFGKKKTPGLEA